VQTQSEALLRGPKQLGARLAIGGVSALIVVGVSAPLLALVWRSLSWRGAFSLRHYLALLEGESRALAVPPWVGVANSLILAGLTVMMALLLGLLAAHLLKQGGRWLDALFMLPLATSAVTLGLGYTLSFDKPPLNLRGSWIVLPILHALVALPFVVRAVLPALRAIHPHWLAAAATLGAGPLARWWRIERPLTTRAAFIGALFAFTVSLGEFGASLFVVRPDVPTVPIMIYRLLGQPSRESYGQALALSVILLLLCALAFFLLERLRRASGSGF
jgi:thiamine transport system permease protein